MFGVKIPRTCSCCQSSLCEEGDNINAQYRRVHFQLNNGTLTFCSFCPECAEHEWTPERLDALNQQLHEAWHQSVCFGRLLRVFPTPDHEECRFAGDPHSRLAVTAVAGLAAQTWSDVQ